MLTAGKSTFPSPRVEGPPSNDVTSETPFDLGQMEEAVLDLRSFTNAPGPQCVELKPRTNPSSSFFFSPSESARLSRAMRSWQK
ncbi:Uncharacterized protein DAT39_016955 [Clarias magur]|uniref:Uncharacterized protein n=1 Tax=Clarias magur TaxID=1594786 RepID=A0A8J4TB71_CLAMG|nr:Uncharacterized protein DAT39_016955 [Clarias magur]